MSNVQTITHESGQMGMFFGSVQDLESFTEQHNNDTRKRDYIMAAAKDYLTSASLNVPSTMAQRFKANLAAIRVLKALRERNSSATRKEQEKLALYCGWGAVSEVFDEKNNKTKTKREQIQSLLTESEYNSARASTISAFYTPHYLGRGIYNMLSAAGFNGGRICDPAAGVGGLIAPMPQEMFDNSNVTLVELDTVTAEALEHLYPNATVYGRKGFEELDLKANQDLVLQNPPFGSAKVLDKNDRVLNGLTLHNYFMAKGVKVLRMGGLMVAIVSTSFLDSKNSKARELVADLAELKGAIRLPKNVFMDHSGANASVDVLLLQRSSTASAATAPWVEATEQTLPTGESYYLNNHFIANPSAILGVMEAQPGIQGKQIQCVSDSKDFVSEIQAAFANHFPADIYCESVISSSNDSDFICPVAGRVSDIAFIDRGGYAMTEDNYIAIRTADDEEGNPTFEVCQEITGKRAARIGSMIKVKQAMNELLGLERTDAPEPKIEEVRHQLNKAYDAFVRQHGYIQESANRRAFGKDPFFANLASLEVDFDSGVTRDQAKRLGVQAVKPSAKKAEIFASRVIKPWVAPTSAESVTDALWIVWNDERKIDLHRVALLCGKSHAEVKNELVGSLLFLNPETAEYDFAEKYLSGDVKTKFAQASAALKGNPELIHNYNALKAILPADIPAVDINVEMNAGWLPVKVVRDFITHLLNCDIEAEHVLGQWFIKATNVPELIENQQFGIKGYPASKIISRMFAGRELIVRRSLLSGGTVIDRDATVQVEGIAAEIKARFDDWIWQCENRRAELETIYNDQFNRWVRPKYTGEMLTFPEQSTQIELRSHQKTCVRRSLEQGSFLIDIAVGGGKTFTIASIVHEWHRLGLKQRTAVVLPNHLVEQIAIEWLRLYPLEKLLVLSPEDMSASKRRETLNRIKTGATIVLVPESTFKSISLPYEAEKDLIQQEIIETRQAISVLEAKFSVKKLETKLKNLEFKLETLTNRQAKDESLDFAELGFDSLCVDEAHAYKNLRFSTVALTNVRGMGNADGSQRAWDMFVKIRYLNDTYDHSGVVFSTGTPISNSIVELWTLQKYLSYPELKAMNLHWLDCWADLYATSTSEFEIDATGTNFKPTARLRSFNNLPELQSMYGCIAETVTKSELNEYLPKLPGGYNMIPPVVGGKPQTVFVDPSQPQRNFIDTLVERAKNFKESPIDNDNMLLLMYHARCASLDLRMLDPTAAANDNSKAVACADRVADIYRQYDADKGTQIVFCDLSTPNKGKERLRAKIRKLMKEANAGDESAVAELEKIGPDQILAADSNFSVYEDLKQLLIERGIADHEIAFAQDYKTPKAKADLYLQLNSGVKRVVLASTAVMGTGANVNRRAVAVHHLDPTYKPSDMEQRTGRVERQGNSLYEADPANFEGVHVLYYATRNSLDAFLYQTLENKANWIEAFRSFKTTERTISDLSGDSVTFAEIKAEVSGNPLVLELLQTSKLIDKLTLQQKRHQQQQHQYEDSLTHYSRTENKQLEILANIEKDIAHYEANQLPKGQFKAVVSGYEVDKFSTAGELLVDELKNFESGRLDDSTTVMRICGFSVHIERHWGNLYLVTRGNHSYHQSLRNGAKTSENAAIHAVTNTLKSLDDYLHRETTYLNEARANLKTAKAEIGKPFDKLEELIAAKRRLTEIKHELMAQDEEAEQLEVAA
ncbi:N-6 DNA methylase (plasmid) [Vibrio campbellii]|uniref:DEAD/DEAH box helicase family protein n=1 Tax=Vibrio campbellii TaxID=680 RepID=UPI001F07D516|nr:DEAD/DEAH box helicase family protein [Vibrio campbellii]UMM06719.1 N-6 DNA methylase [Vibrio campbellii]